ncbi:MAG TPA: SpoIIE family protein phosphatase [Spirochaetota bacterium]|nr:SpoIIE family protein phosphatase [Spirochaetota bacterium]HPV40066.1 SpoIIE family protein phosphatase [Spirochaetota bacterium]
MTTYKEKDIITILGNIPVFQGLAEADYTEITPLLKLEKYIPGDMIIKEGTHGDSMCVIIKGAVKITKTGEAGEEILLDTFYPGSYFGEFSLVDNMPRSANAVCVDETELFRLEKKDFDALLARNGAISTAFYKNCLEETFSRFRNTIANFAFSEHSLRQKSTELEELDRDLSQASQIQSYFINRELLDHEHSFLRNVRHTYVYRPCIAIGGDFLNVTELRPGVASIIIADIMGHGITSALGTGVLKSAYSMAAKELGFKPIPLMKFLNRHFLGVIPHLYATCYYAIIDMRNKRIQLTKAGHPHPLFWKKRRNDFVDIQCQGTGLGLVKKARFGRVSYPLERGDRILFYTDGIIEQKNPRGQMYTEGRLRNIFRDLVLRGEGDIVNKIYEDMKSFASKRAIEDDVTLLLLEF